MPNFTAEIVHTISEGSGYVITKKVDSRRSSDDWNEAGIIPSSLLYPETPMPPEFITRYVSPLTFFSHLDIETYATNGKKHCEVRVVLKTPSIHTEVENISLRSATILTVNPKIDKQSPDEPDAEFKISPTHSLRVTFKEFIEFN